MEPVVSCVLHLDFKAKVNITRRLTAANPPIFRHDFTQHDLYVVGRNIKLRQVSYDALIEPPLGVEGPASKTIDAYMSVILRLFSVWWALKSMGLVHE